MDDIQDITSQMCVSARALGIRKDEWLRVEDKLSIMLRSSGPEYVISYLKDLREAKLAQMTGQDPRPFLAWHKVNSKGEPCGWQAVLWNRRRPSTSIKMVSALINCIEISDDISQKQFEKWFNGVRRPKPMDTSKKWPKLRLFTLRREEQLAKLIAKQSVFQPSDITGVSIPGQYDRVCVPGHVNDTDELLTYLDAYELSLSSAPLFSSVFDKRSIELVQEKYPTIEINEKDQRLNLSRVVYDHAQSRLDEDFPYDPRFLTPRLGEMDIVGQIAFLQQPGGKLRAIGNPNRYVQHLFRPLQKVLSDYANSSAGCYVTDQREGMRWIQKELREGHSLHSMDLSSATDTLDFKNFFRSCTNVPEGSILEDQLETFGLAAQSPWYSPSLGEPVNWQQGQVLGLAPSFSVLTIMNLYACSIAQLTYEKKYGLEPSSPMFAVVGDDAVLRSEIAPYYSAIIAKLGGEANPDKALVSDKYAEFCSHIISPKSIWPLKPKIRGTSESFFVDVEKTGVKRLAGARPYPKSFKDMATYLSHWSSSDLGNLPSIPGEPKPLTDRLYASQYMSIVSHISDKLPDEKTINLGPIFGLTELIKATDDSIDKEISDPLISRVKKLNLIQEWLSESPVKVKVPLMKRTWEWKKGEYVPKVNSITSARTLARNLKKIESMSDFSDNALISGFFDRYQSPVKEEKSSFHLLVDSREDTMYLYQRANGIDYLILDNDQLRDMKITSSAITSRRSKACRGILRDIGLTDEQVSTIESMASPDSALSLRLGISEVMSGDVDPKDLYIPGRFIHVKPDGTKVKESLGSSKKDERVDHTNLTSEDISLPHQQQDDQIFDRLQLKVRRLASLYDGKRLPSTSDDVLDSLPEYKVDEITPDNDSDEFSSYFYEFEDNEPESRSEKNDDFDLDF